MTNINTSSIFETKIEATATFPKVKTVADIIEVKSNDAHNVYSVLDAANQTGIPVMFIGAPGNGKTALLTNMLVCSVQMLSTSDLTVRHRQLSSPVSGRWKLTVRKSSSLTSSWKRS